MSIKEISFNHYDYENGICQNAVDIRIKQSIRRKNINQIREIQCEHHTNDDSRLTGWIMQEFLISVFGTNMDPPEIATYQSRNYKYQVSSKEKYIRYREDVHYLSI